MIKKTAELDVSILERDIPRDEALKTEGASLQFQKLVTAIKKIAPKSDEFLYFRCRALHAGERM